MLNSDPHKVPMIISDPNLCAFIFLTYGFLDDSEFMAPDGENVGENRWKAGLSLPANVSNTRPAGHLPHIVCKDKKIGRKHLREKKERLRRKN